MSETTIETPKQHRLWTCPNCGIRAPMPINSPLPIRCCCGLVDKDYSNSVIIDFDSTKRSVVTHRPKQKPIKICPYRSKDFRLVECDSCRGKVQLKVYQCSEFGECTVSKEIEGVHVCDGGR